MKKEEPFVLTAGYRKYALGLFLLVYIINFVDRQIFSILIEPIRADIELSDTQLGLLGGIAFAIFYTFAGIPIARWADVGVRKNIILAGPIPINSNPFVYQKRGIKVIKPAQNR